MRPRVTRVPSRGALLALVVALGACESSPQAPAPLDADAAGDVSDTGMAGPDADCPPRELFLEIGQGESEYTPLGQGRSPRLFEGPQGSQHMVLALRVKSSASDNLAELVARIVVTSWTPVDCVGGSNTPEGGCLFPVGDREVSFGSRDGELPLAPDIRGVTDALSIYVPVNWWPAAHERRIRATVETPCGESPTALHIVPPTNRPF